MNIYRYFKKKKFAESFMAGHIRFSELDIYKDQACDARRRDTSEGTYSFKDNNNRYKIEINGDPVTQKPQSLTYDEIYAHHKLFICSFSLSPDIKKWGNYRISTNIDILLSELNKKIEDMDLPLSCLKSQSITYYEPAQLENSVDPLFFKPKLSPDGESFEAEQEFRIALVFDLNARTQLSFKNLEGKIETYDINKFNVLPISINGESIFTLHEIETLSYDLG